MMLFTEENTLFPGISGKIDVIVQDS